MTHVLMEERNRFLSFFDQLVEHTIAYATRVHSDGYAVVPIDTPVMFLGTRVNTINIGGLMRHLVLTEALWFDIISKVPDGEHLQFPANAAALLEDVHNGLPILDKYRDLYAAARAKIANMTAGDLNKEIWFAKRGYTALGFLWVVFGHHSFHLGQIDLLMRQQGIEPPEYMEWPKDDGVIG